jgi:HlyD family secretion protein
MTFKKRIKVLCMVSCPVILLLITVTITSCSGMGPFSNFSEGEENQGMEIFEVKKGSIYQTVSTEGLVDSGSMNNYNMQVTGEILSAVEKGDYFKKGDILVKIDNSEGMSMFEQIEKNLNLSEISLKTAKINYQSALDSNHITIQLAELNTEKAEESAKSALSSLESANESAKLSYQSASRALEEAEEMLALAEADPSTTEMQMVQYESSVESAEEQLESTEVSADSSKSQAESSYNQTLISQSTNHWSNLSNLQSAEKQIESTRFNIEQAEIQLELARMDYESAKEDLDDYILYADYDGLVISSDFEEGNNNSGSNSISIANKNFLITATIGETDIPKISVNDKAYITLDAYPDYQFSGKVKKIIPVMIEEGNIASFEIVVDFDNTENAEIFYGFSVSIDIVVEMAEDVLCVPIQAVYEEGGKSYVDVLVSGKEDTGDREKSVKKTEITTGINDYSYIEVTSGLNQGDIVITSRI